MAITADEARELMHGSMERKGLIFRAVLAWICGRINVAIENAAESGYGHICYEVIKGKTAIKYFPLIAQLYEKDKYVVMYCIYRREMAIIWNWDQLSELNKRDYLKAFYDYHTDGISMPGSY